MQTRHLINSLHLGIRACGGPFLIQSVREVYLYRIGTGEKNARSPAGYLKALGNKGCSNVELIQLGQSRLTRSELFAIVEAPRALKSFIYEVGEHLLAHDDGFSLPDVHEALSGHKASLEDLWLDYAFVQQWVVREHIDDLRPLASLQGFVQLRRLAIAVFFVLGEHSYRTTEDSSTTQEEVLYKLLPPQLEMLHLMHRNEEFDDCILTSLRHLLELKRDPNVFPHLKDIRLDVQQEEADRHVDALIEILRLAPDVGTKVILLRSFSEMEIMSQVHERGTSRGWGWDEDVVLRECSLRWRKISSGVVLELVGGRFCEEQW